VWTIARETLDNSALSPMTHSPKTINIRTYDQKCCTTGSLNSLVRIQLSRLNEGFGRLYKFRSESNQDHGISDSNPISFDGNHQLHSFGFHIHTWASVY